MKFYKENPIENVFLFLMDGFQKLKSDFFLVKRDVTIFFSQKYLSPSSVNKISKKNRKNI